MNQELNKYFTVSGRAQEVIRDYICETFTEEQGKKVIELKKNISDCFSHITKEAKKQAENNCACLSDQEVFDIASEYLIDDSIKLETEAPVAKVKKSKEELKEFMEEQTKIDDEPITEKESKLAAKELAKRKEVVVKKAKKEKDKSAQVSLFDLM